MKPKQVRKMGSSESVKPVEMVVEESEEGLSLEPVNKSKLNGHKTVALDLNIDTHSHLIFTELTRAAIEASAIVSLNLSRCNLNYFPDAFASLRLKRLDLSHNKFEIVPDCLRSGLRFLENLDLSHNALGSFECEPLCVVKLRVLRINNNKFFNIPPWILEMSCCNLEEFYYSYNEISTLRHSRFHHAGSYRLKKIELKNCLLRSEDVKFLKNIRTLAFLDVSNEGYKQLNCFASSDSLSLLFHSPSWDDQLKVLCLNNLQISFLPKEISDLVVLEELHVSQNDLMWLPEPIAKLERLRVLDISHNHIVSLPSDINSLKTLQVLLASHNCISNVPDFYSTNLRVLDLYNNYLDTDCDIKIGGNIVEMDLEQNYVDTRDLNIEQYEEKRNALRLGIVPIRANGPNKQRYDETDDPTDTCSTDSEWTEEHPGAAEQDFKEEVDEEESWSPKPKICDNGCTASDNEWTGSEKTFVKRKKIKRTLETFPDWMFEDD